MKKVLLVVLIAATSCTKEYSFSASSDYDMKVAFAKSPLVGTWNLSGRTVSPAYDWNNDGTSETDVFSVMTACQKQHVYTFGSFSGLFTPMCGIPQQILDPWTYQNDTLGYSINGAPMFYQRVVSLTSTTLVTQYNWQAPNGNTYLLTNTFTKQ